MMRMTRRKKRRRERRRKRQRRRWSSKRRRRVEAMWSLRIVMAHPMMVILVMMTRSLSKRH
jgi:hypothetical protein